MTLLTADNLCCSFDGQVILDKVSLAVNSGQGIGVVGKNGCGKTTLFEIVAGRRELDIGSVSLARKCRLDYAEQDISAYFELPLFEYVASARDDLLAMRKEIALLQQELETNPEDRSSLERLGQLQNKFEVEDGFNFENQVKIILEGLGFPSERHGDLLRRFSGGEKNRASLARLLAGNGNLLLLDEPTNHLDIESTRWLEEYLQTSNRAYLVVSHDRAFLKATVSQVWELYRGKLERYSGGIDYYLTERAARRAQHVHRYHHQQAEIKHLEEYIRRNMAGQKTKQAQSKLKCLGRIKRLPPPKTDGPAARIKMESSGRSYAHVVSVSNVALGYDSEAFLTKAAFDLYRGDRVGLIGRNGSGKTTLLKSLVGELAPIDGDIKLGNNVDVAYFDQELSDLDPTLTVLDSLWELDRVADGGRIRSFLARFGFTGDDPFKVVSSLSGGEKTKLSLAKLLYHPANFIIFDEPTNHLDMDSREALEEALLEYQGSCLIVSHDRYFLDRVANRILHIEAGRLATYEGNYSYFREHTDPADTVRKAKSSKSRDDYLAFKEQSRRRGRLKKDLQKTKERIAQAEADLRQIEIDLVENISTSDWEKLQAAHDRKSALEAELLDLYATLEQLEATDLD